MTEEELASVESALGLALPGYYRDLMLNYPQDLLAASYGPHGEPGEPADDWLHYKPETLIRENHAARNYLGLPGGEGKIEPWPANFMVIANNGGGDHWYIDIAANPGMDGLVWKFDHETGSRYVAVPSLRRWVEHLRGLFQKFQRGEF